jgi:hypothetical protein
VLSRSKTVADDWVEKYRAERKAEGQESEAELIKAKHAQAGAPRLFKTIADRVKRDVEAYGDNSLHYGFVPSSKFIVRRPSYPAVELEVTLSGVAVEYEYRFMMDGASERTTSNGVILIKADLAGNVQAFQNGLPFKDEIEVSEFLLKLVFDYLQ